jgi:hypothetical protein
LETTIVVRLIDFLNRQKYPIRTGTHTNTAFSLTLAYDYAVTLGHSRLREAILQRAHSYYDQDANYQTAQEPSGADFLSPCLVEADLMRRLMTEEAFQAWIAAFLPEIEAGQANGLLTPVEVSDRTDPQIGHLDGLNLSRAWCLVGISQSLSPEYPIAKVLTDAAHHHAIKGLSHVSTGDYVGEHWLASFAVYMLSAFESARLVRVE